jgi:hypothetical protein
MINSKEKTIIELSTLTGYDFKIIELLYNFTNGDKDGIEKILSAMNHNILLVKANFESKVLEKRGFLYIAYDTSKNQMLEKGFYAFKEFEEINLFQGWDDTRKNIFQIKSDGKFDKSMFTFFEKEMNSDQIIKEFKKITGDFLASHKFQTLLDTLLTKALAPVFYNKNFSLDMRYELFDPFLFFKPFMQPEINPLEMQKKADELVDDKKPIITIKVFPELDPINGKNVKELTQDNLVQFEVKDERDVASYIADLIGTNKEDGLSGRVISFNIIDSDTIKLNIEFAPGISGESIVPNTLMVKTIEPYEQQKFKNNSDNQEKKIQIPIKTFIISMIIIMFIVLIFLLLS